MKIKTILLLTTLFIIGLVIFLNKRSSNPNSFDFMKSTGFSFNQQNSQSTDSQVSAFNSVLLTSQSEDDKRLPSAQFLNWFKDQVSDIDKLSNPNAVNEDDYRKKSASLDTNEQIFLVKTLLNPQGPAKSKILSAYILSLETEHNFQAISYTLAQELAVKSGPVHSPEEALSMQEKALRRMLIDSSIQDFQKGRISEKQLIESFNNIPDQGLRTYALSRFAEVSK